jgi:hypothetical protein
MTPSPIETVDHPHLVTIDRSAPLTPGFVLR